MSSSAVGQSGSRSAVGQQREPDCRTRERTREKEEKAARAEKEEKAEKEDKEDKEEKAVLTYCSNRCCK